MPKVIVWLTALVVTVVALGCQPAKSATTNPETLGMSVPVEGGKYTDISATQLKRMLEKKDFLLVNVHIPYEGEIEPTDLFVPYNQIEENLGKFPADKSAKVVLYCRSGSMSAIAARALVKLGYTNIWNLDGGMIGWRGVGLPLKVK